MRSDPAIAEVLNNYRRAGVSLAIGLLLGAAWVAAIVVGAVTKDASWLGMIATGLKIPTGWGALAFAMISGLQYLYAWWHLRSLASDGRDQDAD